MLANARDRSDPPISGLRGKGVTVCLQVPCFRYYDSDLFAELSVEQGRGTDLLIRCPVRRGMYFLTPEERVRQALIWFLTDGASDTGGWRKRLRFEVELRSLDVAAFLGTESAEDRFVFNIPVLIVETKRQERELKGDVEVVEQLKTYMVRERCRAGLIFNAREAVWLSPNGEFTQGSWKEDHLFDLREVEQRLELTTREATLVALNYINASNRAAAGDFDSLLSLISLIGNDSRLTFTLSIRFRGNLSSVQAFGIRVPDADNITHRTRGIVSRNRQQLNRRDFHSLLAVSPL
jgi:hypothetical protein